MTAAVPDGSDLIAHAARSDLSVDDAQHLIDATLEWMGAHLLCDPFTATLREAALAAATTLLQSRSSPGGVQVTDVGPIFLRDSSLAVRRAREDYAIGGFA